MPSVEFIVRCNEDFTNTKLFNVCLSKGTGQKQKACTVWKCSIESLGQTVDCVKCAGRAHPSPALCLNVYASVIRVLINFTD